ncbi:hypothetical protein UPYG_G00222050 [Umbra pygmaea]|uniref:Protein RD3-like n=1 Tax=Umbra pygmaea TaxID=75934 RepID=A0ABD0WZE7_UMBPY
MPLSSWLKWLRAEEQHAVAASTGLSPRCTLIRELMMHMEERERLERDVKHRLAHNPRGFPNWLQSYPRLRTQIPVSERRQLEQLCDQIQPMHTATVLSRFRDVLARNNILPWELVYVFKQVLGDFLNKEEVEDEQEHPSQPVLLGPMEAWTNRYQMKQSFITPTMPDCSKLPREEIPTISAYVDRSMRASGSCSGHRDWDLPYFYPGIQPPPEAYSTML